MKTAAQHNDIRQVRAQVDVSETMLREAIGGFHNEDLMVSALLKILKEADLSDSAYMRLEQAGRIPSELERERTFPSGQTALAKYEAECG